MKTKKIKAVETNLGSYLGICGKDIEEVTGNWKKALNYVDMARRLKVSKAWHAKHPQFTSHAIGCYSEQLERLGEALADGQCERLLGDISAYWNLPLKEILAEKLVLAYEGLMMPNYFDDYYFEPTEAKLAQAEGDQSAVWVPQVKGETIMRLASAKDFDAVRDDKELKALEALIASGKGLDEIRCRSQMRLNEDKARQTLLETMEELFQLCAAQAQALGEAALARQFVEACFAARVWKVEYNRWQYPRYLELLSTTIWMKVDELMCAMMAKKLPTLAEAKKLWKAARKVQKNGK